MMCIRSIYHLIFILFVSYVCVGNAQSLAFKKVLSMDSSSYQENSPDIEVVITQDNNGSLYSISRSVISNSKYVRLQKMRGDSTLWFKNIGKEGIDVIARCITVDSSGDIYIAGVFEDTVDFDTGSGVFNLVSKGYDDAFITKLDSTGNLIWAKSFGGRYNDAIHSIVLDKNSNIYVTGYFRNTVSIEIGDSTHQLEAVGGQDIYVLKLDDNGNVMWGKSMGGSGEDIGNDVTIDNRDNVYVVGNFSTTMQISTIGGDTSVTAVGNNDVCLHKMDTAGNIHWVKTMGGSSYDEGKSIATDNNGNIYILGNFRNTVHFEPGDSTFTLESKGIYDVFVQKIDSAGNNVWVRSLGSTNNDVGNAIMVDNSNNVYLTGAFQNTASFETGDSTYTLESNGAYDIFVLALDKNGNLIERINIGGSSSDRGHYIYVSSSCDVYISGLFRGRVDFNIGEDSSYFGTAGDNLYRPFILQMSQIYDVYFYDIDTIVLCDSSYIWKGKIYTESGLYMDTICDSIIGLHLSIHSSNILSDTSISCGSFLWRDTAYTNSGIYGDTLMTMEGCDSILMLVLTINEVFIQEDTQTHCGSFLWRDTAYTNSGIYGDTLMTMEGCDSILMLVLTINEVFIQEDTQTHCGSFLWRDTAYTNSGIYGDTLMTIEGCDSISILNLTIIDSLDTTIERKNEILIAKLEGGTYQWLDCNDSYSQILGATQGTYIATQSGSYALELKKYGCVDTSFCYTVTYTGVDDIFVSNTSFRIYPNPTFGEVIVDLGKSREEVFVTIRDIFGRVLQSESYTGMPMIHLSLDAFSFGVYFLEIGNSTQNTVFRVVKKDF